MIAGESQDSLEESPNTIRQHAVPRRRDGRRFRKGAATESVTEKTPPVL